MNQPAMPRGGAAQIEIPGRLHPVLAMLAFVPIMTVIMIMLGLAVETTPPVPLIVLLMVVMGCCIMLSWNALQLMLGGTISFDPEGLTVNKLLSEDKYPWTVVEACKVMPATGTLGDDALVELEDRIGLGLFVRGTNRRREHDLDADIVLCAGDKVDAQTLMQIAGKVQAAIKRSESPAARGPARAPARRPAQFQQRPGAAGSKPRPARKADPVAQFRKRANNPS